MSALAAPDTSQLPSSRSTHGGSSSISRSLAKAPAKAAMIEPGVTMPSRWPYSSWTRASGTSAERSTASASIASIRSGITGAVLTIRARSRSRPSSNSISRSRAETTPTMSSTDPRATGSRLCGVAASAARISSRPQPTSIQSISVRGVITSRTGRSASRTMPEMIARSLSSSTPEVCASATTRCSSSAVTRVLRFRGRARAP